MTYQTFTQIDAKIWVENSQPKTYTDDREEPYFLVKK